MPSQELTAAQLTRHAHSVRLLALDVDGVLSDGQLYLVTKVKKLKPLTVWMAKALKCSKPAVSRWLLSQAEVPVL